jgi:hypothetical protein
MARGKRFATAAVVLITVMASPLLATQANARTHFSVGLAFGGPVFAPPPPPVYYAPAPVYVSPPAYTYVPPAVVVEPAPVVTYDPPRYYVPQPVYAPAYYGW